VIVIASEAFNAMIADEQRGTYEQEEPAVSTICGLLREGQHCVQYAKVKNSRVRPWTPKTKRSSGILCSAVWRRSVNSIRRPVSPSDRDLVAEAVSRRPAAGAGHPLPKENGRWLAEDLREILLDLPDSKWGKRFT
jgi:hypothetical protein